MVGLTEKNAGSEIPVTEKLTVWSDSFEGPATKSVRKLGTTCAPESSSAAGGLATVNDGASLTGLIVIVNCCIVDVSLPPCAVPPLSLTTTLTVEVPNWLGAG